jgi:hypothetical protein
MISCKTHHKPLPGKSLLFDKVEIRHDGRLNVSVANDLIDPPDLEFAWHLCGLTFTFDLAGWLTACHVAGVATNTIEKDGATSSAIPMITDDRVTLLTIPRTHPMFTLWTIFCFTESMETALAELVENSWPLYDADIHVQKLLAYWLRCPRVQVTAQHSTARIRAYNELKAALEKVRSKGKAEEAVAAIFRLAPRSMAKTISRHEKARLRQKDK